MPLATIASAVSRISCSLTLQPNLFQLFQPICGVFASPSNFWANAADPCSVSAANNANLIMPIAGLLSLLRIVGNAAHAFGDSAAHCTCPVTRVDDGATFQPRILTIG